MEKENLSFEDLDVVEQGLYVLVDTVADRSSPVFEAVNHKVALKLILGHQAVKLAPGDYRLQYVGYRTRKGEVVAHPEVKSLIEIVLPEEEKNKLVQFNEV